MIDFLTQVIEEGDYVLSQTPEMLPVLKQAGVVDSGGQGLMQVMKGGLDGLLGKGSRLMPLLRQPETQSPQNRRLLREVTIFLLPILSTATALSLS